MSITKIGTDCKNSRLNRITSHKTPPLIKPERAMQISATLNDASILSFKGIHFYKQAFPCITKKISFMGYPVHIVDGSNHATNVAHFAKAIEKNMDIEMHEVEVNKQDKNLKQLKSLENELKTLNNGGTLKKGDYVAVPALATVPLLNLSDQIKAVTGREVLLNAENVKANAPIILSFLKEIYVNPDNHRQYINYMDTRGQGLEYTWGVIQQLNKLKEKGANVYVPAGHPHDDTLKWMAGQRGLKPEFYNYIATGQDKDSIVNAMAKEVKEKNWYTFNLLALSNTHIATVKEANGLQDYMFAAYDTCITDGERGVYNFSPVRKDGKLIGYSYTDTKTNEYPFEEFPANHEIENIVKFVGKNIDEVIASDEETKYFKKLIGKDTSSCPDKLYAVKDIFSADKIIKEKLDIQGDFTDKSLKLFFRKNKENTIIFPKCDCEGSGKPSVLSMWGSCFSVFNAIAKDIKIQEKRKQNFNSTQNNDYLQKAESDEKKGNYESAEYLYNKILENLEIQNSSNNEKYKIHEKLSAVLLKQNKISGAKYCFNKLIDMNCAAILKDCSIQHREIPVNRIIENILNRKKTEEFGHNYFKNILKAQESNTRSELEMKIALHYSIIGDLCAIEGETYPSEVCQWASEEIVKGSCYGDKIIGRRAKRVSFIGDLYDECH